MKKIVGEEHIYDYHWYRQNPDGTWSDKQGELSVRPSIIYPEKDAKKQGYDTVCGDLCIPNKGINVD